MGTELGHQDRVGAFRGGWAEYWRDIYEQDSLRGLIYRERMAIVLDWIDELKLPPGSTVLDVGCGAGQATLELARRGFAVESVDFSAEMVALASQRVADAGLGETVTVRVANVNALQQSSESFALVLAIGVLPWIPSLDRAIGELARVLAPGGYLIVSADNRLRLNRLVEPSENPLLAPLRAVWRRRPGWRPNPRVSRRHSPRQVNRALVAAGLEPGRWTTVGFGPFTFRSRSFLGDRLGLRLHFWQRELARRGVPGFRRAGWHYVVSARRRPRPWRSGYAASYVATRRRHPVSLLRRGRHANRPGHSSLLRGARLPAGVPTGLRRRAAIRGGAHWVVRRARSTIRASQ